MQGSVLSIDATASLLLAYFWYINTRKVQLPNKVTDNHKISKYGNRCI